MVQRLHSRFPATRHRDFRFLWGGTAASNVALWTLLLGNAWAVYHLSESSAWVGVSTFASMSPFLLAPFGGTIADRIERRLLVRLTRLGALAVTGVLFALAATGVLEVWMVITLALLQGLVRAVELPSDQALVANVVPPEHLANAVALTSMTQHGSRAVGPILAGPLLATVGPEGAYGIAVLFALVAFLTVRQVRTSSRGGVERLADVAGNLREGIAYVRSTGPVAAVFILVTAHCALTMSFDAMLPGFSEEHIHGGETGFTVMVLGVGVGALLGTFLLSANPDWPRGPVFLATALVSGLSPVLMAISVNVGMAAVSASIMGLSQAMFMALAAVLLQEVLPDAVRGRVMSLFLMVAGGVMAFANLLFAWAADAVGAPALFLVPGLVFVVIVLGSFRTGPYLRGIYRSGQMPAPSPAALPGA